MNLEHFESYRKKFTYFLNSSRIYFDSSSFTLLNDLVLDAVNNFYKSGGTRALTGLYPGTSLASVTIEQCRQSLRDFLSIVDGELMFPLTRGIGVLQILYSLSLKNKIRIFPYSGLDHDIWLPIFEFASQQSLLLIPLTVQNSLEDLNQEIAMNITESKNILCVIVLPFTSLGNGLRLNSSFLKKLKTKSNVFILLDMTYAVGVTDINFSELEIDAAVFDSNIGLGGPIGSGILYCKKDLYEYINPYMFFGNGSVSKVTSTSFTLDDVPQRLESSINPSVFAGLTKSIEILKELKIVQINAWIKDLVTHFFEVLEKFPDVKLLGLFQKESYHNIIGFIIPGFNMHELAMFLDEINNIDIRSGAFCSHQLIEQLYSKGNLINSHYGILQISLHYYTSKEDINKLFMGIQEFLNIMS